MILNQKRTAVFGEENVSLKHITQTCMQFWNCSYQQLIASDGSIPVPHIGVLG